MTIQSYVAARTLWSDCGTQTIVPFLLADVEINFKGMTRLISFFFFFQAEDGIRDVAVTGVQTCALPISTPRAASTGQVPPAPRDSAARGSEALDPRASPLARHAAPRAPGARGDPGRLSARSRSRRGPARPA